MEGEVKNTRAFINLLIVMFSLAFAVMAIYYCISKIYHRQRGRDVLLEFNGGVATRADVVVSIEASTAQLIAPPSRIFRKVDDLVGGDDGGGGEERMCPVCLSEFEDGEAVRFLPECEHCFHAECIDMWFRWNSTCPICRAQALCVLR